MVSEDRVLYTFLELVQTDHRSGEEQLLAQRVVTRLRSLGLKADIDPVGNVIARLKGRGDPILLSAHLDSVDPCTGVVPVVEKGIIRSDGRTILGADDLSGVAAIIEALQVITEKKIEHRPVEVVLTVEEETGLTGSKGLNYGDLKARLGIVLDGGGPFGAVIIAAPSHNIMTTTILGKAAHAGVAPEEGVNAIRVAAEAIARMPLGRVDKETTANIGEIHGGIATNIVPDRVEVTAEARSRNERKLRRQTQAMSEAFEKAAAAHGAEVKSKVERAYSGFTLSEDDEIIQLAKKAIEAVGVTPRLEPTGGGSDTNIFNAHGIACANLSTGMMNAHTTEEWIAIEDLVRCAQVVLEFVRIDHEEDE
jgi:tripeptide aminopeptidase